MDYNENLPVNSCENVEEELLLEPKPLFDLTKNDLIFSVVTLCFSIFMGLFGLFSRFALGYFLATLMLGISTILYFIKGSKLNVTSVLCALISFLNGTVFLFTTNGSVKFFAIITNLLLMFISLDGLINPIGKRNRDTFRIFISALSSISNINITVKSLFSKIDGEKKSLGKVLIGLACAIPVLIVVIPLLISSDDAFEGLVTKILSNCFISVLKALVGVIIAIFIISYAFSLKNGRIQKSNDNEFSGIDGIYLASFLSAISLCYILYLFSQLAYFFSAFKGLLPNGDITYAQYARKGFFEMCTIAIINLLIVIISLVISKKTNGKPSCIVCILTTFISVFTLIIIATSISKMVLYINEYGMTVLRLTTSAFMIFLSVVFITSILRVYINNINIIKTSLIFAGLITLLLGTVNVNAVCASYNYNAYISNKLDDIDIKAIYEFGEEGIPYIIKLTVSEDHETAMEARRYLSKMYLYDYFDNMQNAQNFTLKDLKKNQKYSGFEYFNIPRHKGYKMLYKFIEKNPNFSSYCQDYYNLKAWQHYL